MVQRRSLLLLTLIVCVGWSSSFAAGPVPSDPLYIRIDNGWKGVFAHGDEYAEYSFKGPDIKLQDPYHVLLKPRLGMMVTFADKSQFASGADLLVAHEQWELGYWRQHAAKVESALRNDLTGGRADLRATEIRLTGPAGQQAVIYMVALAAKDGVFVLSLSPADSSIDTLAGEIAGSFKLVRRQLDTDEVKRVSMAAKAGQ